MRFSVSEGSFLADDTASHISTDLTKCEKADCWCCPQTILAVPLVPVTQATKQT